MTAAQRYETLSGPEKAAIVMLALSEEHATRIFALLDFEEVKDLSQIMSLIGRVETEVVERVLQEFGQKLLAADGVVGGFDATEKLLARCLDKSRVDQIMGELRGPAGRSVWDKLGNVNEAVLAGYLQNEYPQTVALVLSKIDAAHAARVLANFPQDFAVEVVLRMLGIDVVQKDVLTVVENTLRTELRTNLARTGRRDNHELMAEIFNFLDRATESRVMASLQERDKDAAERIRSLMFTFEDLARIDSSSIQILLRNAGNDRIATALKGASDRIKELFFANMSERAAKILREEMQIMGPIRLRDVEEAQQFLVNMAKERIASGEILLTGGNDGQLVY